MNYRQSWPVAQRTIRPSAECQMDVGVAVAQRLVADIAFGSGSDVGSAALNDRYRIFETRS